MIRDHASLREDEIEWPAWVPLAMLGVAAISAGATIADRIVQGYGTRPVLYVLIAISPWVLDALDVALPFRTALPLWAFPIPSLAGTTFLVANPVDNEFAPFILVFVVAEVAARAEDIRFSAAVAAIGIGVMVGVDYLHTYNHSYVWWIGIAFAWFGGFLIQALFRRTAEVKRAQAGLAQKAVADERSRVAREVHDVIAHSMSVTMLHITAARMALERGQASAALESLREAETQGRNSLNDIRRTVGLLGAGEDAEATAEPMPTVTDLPKLTEDFRTAGLDVTLGMHGDVRAIAPAAGLNIYRIAQESLTNASKYAPDAPARVTLNIADDQITLCVRNGRGDGSLPPASGNGLGIRGMIERAALLDGTLQAGADGDGWVVLLTAPRETTP